LHVKLRGCTPFPQVVKKGNVSFSMYLSKWFKMDIVSSRQLSYHRYLVDCCWRQRNTHQLGNHCWKPPPTVGPLLWTTWSEVAATSPKTCTQCNHADLHCVNLCVSDHCWHTQRTDLGTANQIFLVSDLFLCHFLIHHIYQASSFKSTLFQLFLPLKPSAGSLGNLSGTSFSAPSYVARRRSDAEVDWSVDWCGYSSEKKLPWTLKHDGFLIGFFLFQWAIFKCHVFGAADLGSNSRWVGWEVMVLFYAHKKGRFFHDRLLQKPAYMTGPQSGDSTVTTWKQ